MALLVQDTPLTEVQRYIILSCLARGDETEAMELLIDWMPNRYRCIYKWIPGNHYYALNEKFNTLQEAKDHLRNFGYQFKCLIEQRIYPVEQS
jgi:hypothetical protein